MARQLKARLSVAAMAGAVIIAAGCGTGGHSNGASVQRAYAGRIHRWEGRLAKSVQRILSVTADPVLLLSNDPSARRNATAALAGFKNCNRGLSSIGKPPHGFTSVAIDGRLVCHDLSLVADLFARGIDRRSSKLLHAADDWMKQATKEVTKLNLDLNSVSN